MNAFPLTVAACLFPLSFSLAETTQPDNPKSLVSYYRDLLLKSEKTKELVENKVYSTFKGRDGATLRNIRVKSFNEKEIVAQDINGRSLLLTYETAPQEWVDTLHIMSPEAYSIFLNLSESSGVSSAPQNSKNFSTNLGNEIFSDVVVVEGDVGNGTGFLCNVDGVSYIYTAAHVLSGNTRITIKDQKGNEFRSFDSLETAEGLDLLRLRLSETHPSGLDLATSTDDIKVGDKIAALGNGAGGGVIAPEWGEVMGISADFFEINADIVPGNSGGPVLEGTSKRAIGVVTHATQNEETIWTRNTRYTEIRRYAARIDKEHTWKEQSIGSFIGEGKAIAAYDKLTRLLFALCSLDAYTDGLRLGEEVSEGSGITIQQVLRENEDRTLVKNFERVNEYLSRYRGTMSKADARNRIVSIFRQAESLAQSTKREVGLPVTSSFHENEIKLSVEWREKAIERIKRRISRLD